MQCMYNVNEMVFEQYACTIANFQTQQRDLVMRLVLQTLRSPILIQQLFELDNQHFDLPKTKEINIPD